MSKDPYPKEQVASSAQTALEILQKKGFFLDEDGTFTRQLMEHYTEEIESHVRELGYDGGPLRNIGNNHDQYGSVNMIFDTEAVTYERARDILHRYCEEAARNQVLPWRENTTD